MARTVKEILSDRKLFTEEQANHIEENALSEATKYWGGVRDGAGRKCISGDPLTIVIRVSEAEQEAIRCARECGINLLQLLKKSV